jgi:nucleoside-diphosphate-sugar epimerase
MAYRVGIVGGSGFVGSSLAENLFKSFLTHFQTAVLETLWISDRALAALLRLDSWM